jgi:DNA-binding transcriptional MocR family regulator
MEPLFKSRLSLDLGAALLEQLVAADLLRDGEDLLVHRREQLRASRDAALAAVAEHLPDWRPTRPTGGLNLWCELPEALSSALVPRAERHDVLLASGPSFAPEGGLDRFVRLPYTLPAHVLTDAIARLGTAWQETLADPGFIARGAPSLVA